MKPEKVRGSDRVPFFPEPGLQFILRRVLPASVAEERPDDVLRARAGDTAACRRLFLEHVAIEAARIYDGGRFPLGKGVLESWSRVNPGRTKRLVAEAIKRLDIQQKGFPRKPVRRSESPAGGSSAAVSS